MYILGLDVRLKECELLHVNVCKLNKKWIPVGCIPTAAVACHWMAVPGVGQMSSPPDADPL